MFYTRKTFTDSEDHEIIEEGYKVNMSKDMGVCPCDFPTKKICIYFSWRKEFDLETNSRLFQPIRHQEPTKTTWPKMGLY